MKIIINTRKFISSIWSKIQNNHTYLYILLLSAVLLRILFPYRPTPQELSFWKYDPLFIAAVTVFGIVFRVSLDIPDKMDITIKRLLYRGIINCEDHLQKNLKNRAEKWGKIYGLLLALVIIIGWTINWFPKIQIVFEPKPENIFIIIFETFLAYLAGCIFGTMVAYGTLGSILKKEKINLNLQPDHIDGTAGLKPVGEFYFFQFIIASMPAFFIAGSWFLLTVLEKNGILIPQNTSQWKDKIILLLPLAMLFEVLVFILPMLSFNAVMRNFKTNLLNNSKKMQAESLISVDQIGNEITTLQAQLFNVKNEQEYNFIKSKLSYLSEKYQAYEQMPIWPVSPRIRRLFTVNNLILLIPIFLKNIPTITNFIHKINLKLS